MLLVETYIGPSDIHGIGLFAAKNIKKGTPVWEYNQNTTQIFWKKQFLAMCREMSLPAILEFIDHSYIKDGNIYYLNDRTKFINHSLDPNIAFRDSHQEIAIKNIIQGEEITEDYALSYDKNDFFFWDINQTKISKQAIISQLQIKLNKISRPIRSFHV